MLGNFTDGQTVKVKEESSDFNSTIGLEKINLSRKNNLMLNETNGKILFVIFSTLDMDNDSDSRESKGGSSGGFFKDYLLNQRPGYYGDTSDILSKSRKLYY